LLTDDVRNTITQPPATQLFAVDAVNDFEPVPTATLVVLVPVRFAAPALAAAALAAAD
jgi:hypothetical protein